MSFRDFRSTKAEEIQHFLSSIHVENKFSISSPGRIRISGHDLGAFSFYRTSGSIRYALTADRPGPACVIHSVIDGVAEFWRDGQSVVYGAGAAAPLSAAKSTRIRNHESLALKTVIIDSALIDQLCAKWLGRALDGPVVFAHRPFCKELQQLWDSVVWSFDKLLASDHQVDLALHGLVEYAVGLLLQRHPHNFSAYLDQREMLNEQQIKDAQKFIDDNAHLGITPADVAAHIGSSMRKLNQAFCEKLGGPPGFAIYMARMVRAHRLLSEAEGASSIIDIARQLGFVDLARFSETYKIRFDGAGNEALRRARNPEGPRSNLTPQKIDLLRHYINASLGNPITTTQLASLVGLGRQQFHTAFKEAFGISPGQYVILERLEWARWLLRNTTDNIAHIAVETGFSSQSHLTTSLRRYDGVTPKQLRESSRFRV
jgi:transcriptional regulator GlxA family with amidase domain